MSPADADDPMTQRLIQLEIKASFTEDLLDKLDQVVIGQQAQIDRLKRELQRLRQQTSTDADPTSRNLRDELPPHY
jgi:SlyX protein